ncbi:MAG: hypothetical protein DLM58_05365 [Pseudonocardiales bacterium]|nr:MAG: hypothetical protein DLM58_05365 [Pseudonocardiales bacterium]
MPQPQRALPTSGPEPGLLAIYLNDHLAGAAGGLALARRLADNHRETSAAADLAWLAEQVAEDRDTLIALMEQLKIPRTKYKEPVAWLAEKVGRFKPNGHLLSRSPLSSVVELEGMRLGIEGKAAGWRSLRTLAEKDKRLDQALVDQMLVRASEQADRVEHLHARAAAETFVLA